MDSVRHITRHPVLLGLAADRILYNAGFPLGVHYDNGHPRSQPKGRHQGSDQFWTL
jgi:hypothetical protein